MSPTRFAKLGFFHFVKPHENPVKALSEPLKQADDLQGALIVLPEAFNLGRAYLPTDREPPLTSAKCILEDLGVLAECNRACFVVSVLELEECVYRNKAYLIQPHQMPKLITVKASLDESRRYAPQDPETAVGVENPIRDIQVACLICVDATENGGEQSRRRRNELVSSLPDNSVLCIPAHMSATYTATAILTHIEWSNKDERRNIWTVLANSKYLGTPSFIGYNKTVVFEESSNNNKICILPCETPMDSLQDQLRNC